MRCLSIALFALIWSGDAFAQAPAPSTTVPKAPASTGMHFDMVGPSLIYEACSREKLCGCSEGVETCVANLGKASLPASTVACLAFQPCEVYCESKDAGLPGTRLHTACLTPQAQATAKAQFRKSAVRGVCEATKACGCPGSPTIDACVADVDKALGNAPGAFFACMMSQPCAAICDPKGMEPGHGIHTQCMQPALAAHRAKQSQTSFEQLKVMQADHRLKMSIIRSMGGSGQRYRVYDANGRYLRTE